MGIEDILMNKALEEEQFRNQSGDFALAIGGGTGSVLGVMNGKGPKNKMAGGLIGLILGGGLGKGMQQQLVGESPAAALLAKMQVQGSLNTAEKYQLEQMVKEAYSNQLGGIA